MPNIRKVKCTKCSEEYSAAGIRMHEQNCKGKTNTTSTHKEQAAKPDDKPKDKGLFSKLFSENFSENKALEKPTVKPEAVGSRVVLPNTAQNIVHELRSSSIKSVDEVPFHNHINNFEKRVCAEIIDGKCEHCMTVVKQGLFLSTAPKVCYNCGSKLFPEGKKPDKCKLSYASISHVKKVWHGLECDRCENTVESKYIYCPGCGANLIHGSV